MRFEKSIAGAIFALAGLASIAWAGGIDSQDAELSVNAKDASSELVIHELGPVLAPVVWYEPPKGVRVVANDVFVGMPPALAEFIGYPWGALNVEGGESVSLPFMVFKLHETPLALHLQWFVPSGVDGIEIEGPESVFLPGGTGTALLSVTLRASPDIAPETLFSVAARITDASDLRMGSQAMPILLA